MLVPEPVWQGQSVSFQRNGKPLPRRALANADEAASGILCMGLQRPGLIGWRSNQQAIVIAGSSRSEAAGSTVAT